MGIYLNPKDTSKEKWLQQHATRTFGHNAPSINEVEDNEAIVCLVDNGMFTAAAVAYSQSEIDAFQSPGDDRPKIWLVVNKPDLMEACPEYASFIRETG